MSRPLLLLLVGVLSASLCTAHQDVMDDEISHNDFFMKLLEDFRGIMKTGSPDFGIPQLDPFVVPDKQLNLQLKEISVKGDIKNLAIPGLSQFNVEDLSIELAQGKLAVSLSLPDISATGQYDLSGTISYGKISLPLEGQGELTADVKAMTLATKVDLGISNQGEILLDDFAVVWNVSDIQVQLGGLYNGSDLGKMINKILADTLPGLVTKTYHEKITSFITTLVKEKGGAFLKDLHKDHGTPSPAVQEKSQDDSWQHRDRESLLRAANTAGSKGNDAGERPRPLTSEFLFGGVPLQIQMTKEARLFPHGALSTSNIRDDEEQGDEEESWEEADEDSGEEDDEEPEEEADEEEEDKENDDRLLNIQLLGKPKFYPHGALSKGEFPSRLTVST